MFWDKTYLLFLWRSSRTPERSLRPHISQSSDTDLSVCSRNKRLKDRFGSVRIAKRSNDIFSVQLPRRFPFLPFPLSFSLGELEVPRPTETRKDLKEGERCSRVCVAVCARMRQRVIKSKRHLCRLHLPSRKKHLTVPPQQGRFLTVENTTYRI